MNKTDHITLQRTQLEKILAKIIINYDAFSRNPADIEHLAALEVNTHFLPIWLEKNKKCVGGATNCPWTGNTTTSPTNRSCPICGIYIKPKEE